MSKTTKLRILRSTSLTDSSKPGGGTELIAGQFYHALPGDAAWLIRVGVAELANVQRSGVCPGGACRPNGLERAALYMGRD